MGIFKKISSKFIKNQLEKKAEGLPPDQQAQYMANADQAADLVSTSFEDGAKSGVKVLAAFVGGFLSGGPVKAFGDGLSVSASEAAKNQLKFIQEVQARGIPLTINGEFITPAPPQEEIDGINFNAKTIAIAGASIITVATIILLIPKSKN
jgi:hypothetical protein